MRPIVPPSDHGTSPRSGDRDLGAGTTGVADNAVIHTLDNGLVVLVRDDPSAPVVSAQAWCRAGSIDEGRWLGAGLSHVLEHMLFKGTATRGAGRIDQEVQRAGGSMNAYTSFDRTVYWINVPDSGATVAIDILCDIAQHATLPEDELAKELDVIRREMDMCHDDPARRASRRLFETAYTRSPYRYPIIGLPDIFNTLTRADVAAYYREKYAPNNLFMVVVGNVRGADAIDQITRAFRETPARSVPLQPLPDEPRQTAPRELIEEAPIELGHTHASWHIPDVRHPDIPALDVLSVVLGGGRSSRLFRRVRETGLAHSADAWTYSPGNPGLFGLSGIVDADRFRSAADAMLVEVERIRAEGVADAEVSKAIKQLTAGTLAARKTMQGQAQDLGASWLAAGDLAFSERYLASVRRVTPADVQQVARTYLDAENRTLYALLPRSGRASLPQVTIATTSRPVEKFTLPNGLRLLVKEDHRLPFVELRAVFKGGVPAETPANNGITSLMSKLLLKGTRRRSAEQLALEIEAVGGSIDTYAGNNSFGVSIEVLESDFSLGLDLLADVVRNPDFPVAELEREREFQLATIRAQKDHLLQLAGRAMRRRLFGDAGYGLDPNGTEPSVTSLALDPIRAFHQRLAVANNCVVAIYGHVESAAVRGALERLCDGWLPTDTAMGTPAASHPPLPGPVRVEEFRDKKQAVVVLGFAGTDLTSPDRYALELIQEACSDLGSRLFLRIRDELGLAYYVGAQNFVGLVPGFFSFYAGTEPANAQAVVDEFLVEIEKLRGDGLSGEELERSKAKIIGQKKIARQDLGHYAMTTALDELYGLGYANAEAEDDHLQAVSLEDVVRVARRYLTPSAYVLAIAKPPGGA